MKKSEFIDRVAEKAEMSKAAAARAVEAIFDTTSGAISEVIRAGEHVALPGFGRFRAKKRPARKGRNPQTGAEIDIPERTVVQFSAGSGLRDALAGGGTAKKSAGAAKKTGGAAKKSGGAAKKTGGAAKSAGGAAKKTGGAAKKSGGAAKQGGSGKK